jgi:hypothetical protein
MAFVIGETGSRDFFDLTMLFPIMRAVDETISGAKGSQAGAEVQKPFIVFSVGFDAFYGLRTRNGS